MMSSGHSSSGAHVSVATTPRGATEMSQADLFEFDRTGYLLVKQMLLADEVSRLHAAVRALEVDARARLTAAPAVAGQNYFASRGYHALVNAGVGSETPGDYRVLVLEDFWNADAAFDLLVDHAPTNVFMSALIQEQPRLNNSQIFLRYPGSESNLHSGGWAGGRSHGAGSKYRYAVNQLGVDCMMVRAIYFTQAVRADEGAFTVLPVGLVSAYIDVPSISMSLVLVFCPEPVLVIHPDSDAGYVSAYIDECNVVWKRTTRARTRAWCVRPSTILHRTTRWKNRARSCSRPSQVIASSSRKAYVMAGCRWEGARGRGARSTSDTALS